MPSHIKKIFSNRYLWVITLSLALFSKGFSQAPLFGSLLSSTVSPDGSVEFVIQGVFLNDPISATVGSCDCIQVLGPNKQNGFTFLTCSVSASEIASSGCVGNFPITVTNATGSGTSGFTLEIPALPVVDPISPIYLSKATVIPDSLRGTYNYNVKANPGFTPRGFQFEWDVALPLPNPLPTTRFANPSDFTIQSNLFTYGGSGDLITERFQEIGYPILVDSVTTEDFTDAVTLVFKRKYKYYIKQIGPFPSATLPLFQGLGLSYTGDTLSYDDAVDIDIYSSVAGSSFLFDIWPGSFTPENFYEDDDLEPQLSRNIIAVDHLVHQVIFDEHNIAAPNAVVDSTVNNSGTPFQLSLEHQRYKEYFAATNRGDTSWVTYSIKRTTDTAITASQIQASLSGADSNNFSVMDLDTISLTNDSVKDFRVAYHPMNNAPSHNADFNISVGGRSYQIPLIGVLTDTVGPSLSISDTNDVLSVGDTAVFTLHFSEPVLAFTKASLSFVPDSSASSAVLTTVVADSLFRLEFHNLPEGEYSFYLPGNTVNDPTGNGNLASDTISFTIENVSTLAVSIDSVANVLCRGDNSGYLEVTVSGGTAPYTYSWSNSATGASINNISAGTYTVTVTDANSGTATTSETVTEPTPLNAGTILTN